MEYKTAQTKLQLLSGRLHYLLLISIGLLISNIFLVWLVGWSLSHQKRVIVPAVISQDFTLSDNAVDASYLRQMAVFFVTERLNITPSNITHNHNIVLQYTDPKFYHDFVAILEKEKQAVLKQNISSVFYPEEILPNSQKLSVLIKGSLVHWVGSINIAPVKKIYLLQFHYHAGDLKITSFTEITETDFLNITRGK